MSSAAAAACSSATARTARSTGSPTSGDSLIAVDRSRRRQERAGDARSMPTASSSSSPITARASASIDLADGERTLLPRQDGKPLRGDRRPGPLRIDLLRHLQWRLPGAAVASQMATAARYDQPMGDCTLPDPTQIAFDGKRLLIVADSGWAGVGKSRVRAPAARQSSPSRCRAECQPHLGGIFAAAAVAASLAADLKPAPSFVPVGVSLGQRRRRLSADPAVPRRRPGVVRGLRGVADAGLAADRHAQARPDKLSEYECGFPGVRGRRAAVRRALLSGRDPVHRVRSRGGLPLSVGGQPRLHQAGPAGSR